MPPAGVWIPAHRIAGRRVLSRYADPNHDGHHYVAAAVEKGAAAVVVGAADAASPVRVVQVPDTLGGLAGTGVLGACAGAGAVTVIAVTGSAGKTTTKDAIADVARGGPCRWAAPTEGNFNNHVGLPLSHAAPARRAASAGVLEMGMNHAGETEANWPRLRVPDVGVVTNVGYAHVEFFDSIDGVAAAKRELIECLPKEGVAVLNADDERVLAFRDVHPGRAVTFGFSERAKVRGEVLEEGPSGSKFRALGVEFETGMPGRHAILNLLAAIAVADVFGVDPRRLREAVRQFGPGKMRGERLEHNGITVWNDCYNANPEAMKSMIEVLRATPAGRRIAVLGEMRELGSASEMLHREVGHYAATHGVDLLVAVHGHAVEMAEAAGGTAMYFDDPVEAGEFARKWARPGDAVLFKGSRGVKMERALERFLS